MNQLTFRSGLEGIVQLNVFFYYYIFLGYKTVIFNNRKKKSKGKKSDSDWATQSVARREPSCTRIGFFLFLTLYFSFYDDDLISEIEEL